MITLRIQKVFRLIKGIIISHRLQTVILFVTNKCNAQCKTCFYWRQINTPIKELTLEEITEIALHLGRFETLQISGGEPFLRKDLTEICKIFIAFNKITSIHIPTNCLLPDKIFSETEKILQLSRETVIRVCCALDGLGDLHDNIRGVHGNFDNFLLTIKGLKQLSQRYQNFKFHVLTTLCDSNYKEIDKIRKFVLENLQVPHGIDMVRRNTARIKEIEDIPLQFKEGYFQKQPKHIQANSLWEMIVENLKYEQRESFNYFSYKLIAGEKRTLHCSAGKNVIVIEPDGGLRFCENGEIVGYLREHAYDIKRIFKTKQARALRRKIKETNCACDHSLFLSASLSYSRYYALRSVIKGVSSALFKYGAGIIFSFFQRPAQGKVS